MEAAMRGAKCAWFAPSYKYLAEPTRDFERALAPIIARHDRVEKRMEFATGGSLDFWTLEDPDAGRGRFYDLASVDEAGFVVDLRSIWHSAIRPTLADRKGRAIFAGTPKGTGDFHRLFLEAECDTSGAWAAFRIGSGANPFLDREEVEAMRSSLPKAVADQELVTIRQRLTTNRHGERRIKHLFHRDIGCVNVNTSGIAVIGVIVVSGVILSPNSFVG